MNVVRQHNSFRGGQTQSAPTAAFSSVFPEQSLLGTLISNSARYEEVWPDLRPEHFSDPLHQRLYARIGAMVNAGMRADLITLRPWVEKDDEGRAEGGASYLAKLVRAMQPTALKDYAAAIFDSWRRRQLIDTAHRLAAEAADTTLGFDEITSRVDAGLELAQDGRTAREGLSFTTALDSGIERVRQAIKDKGAGGLHTGMPHLDRAMPLVAGRFYVVGGYSGVGKSALVWGWAVEAAIAMREEALPRQESDPATGEVTTVPGDPDVGRILGVSLEMGGPDLALRAACAELRISYADATSGFGDCNEADALRAMGRLEQAEKVHDEYRARMLTRLEEAKQQLQHLPIWFEDLGRMTTKMIQMKARSLRRKYKRVRAIVIDHMQLVPGEPGRSGNGILELANVVHSIMELAKEFECPVIGLAQLKRALAERPDKRPQTSDIAWGQAFETDADAICLLHRDDFWLEKEEPRERLGSVDGDFRTLHDKWLQQMDAAHGHADIFIEKNRHGPTGHVPLWFAHETMRFEEDIEAIVRKRKAAKADAERRSARRKAEMPAAPPPWHERIQSE